jgi:hypothetical protein
MNNISTELSSLKTGIVFLSGSAGELDWILPIIDDLLKKDFNIKIIFLTRHVRLSVKNNQMLNDYISQTNPQLETFLCGGYFIEKIEHFAYLLHRASIKFKLGQKPLLQTIYSFLNKILQKFYLMRMPSQIFKLKDKKCLFFSEYPSLRRPRDLWFRQAFKQALFFYCPHSPHIYSEDLDTKQQKTESINFENRYFLLLGHPADYPFINDGMELASEDLEKVFIGHPKYSNTWLHEFKEKSQIFRSSFSKRSETNILIYSRGSGSYLDDQSHVDLAKTAISGIDSQIENYNLLVKKHPREKNSYWDIAASTNPKIKIIDDHVMKIGTSVDFVITFWGSGAMDCYALGLPVIELFNPNKHPKQQVPHESGYTTIYRLLGIVLPANNLEELVRAIASLKNNNFSLPSLEPHPFYNELLRLSNDWNTKFEKILASHDLINS